MSQKPLLQVALDTVDLNSALQTTRLVHDVVDIIEAGTILCLAQGLGVVRTLKTLYPDKLVLADVRVAEAGALIAKLVFDAGADWISVLSSASLKTIGGVAEEAFARGGDVQIELQEDWSNAKLDACQAMGIRQVIFHQSRDSENKGTAWAGNFMDLIRSMSDRGFKVSITGNLSAQDLAAFKGIPIYSFVAGRAIRDAADPRAAAQAFKDAIRDTWQ